MSRRKTIVGAIVVSLGLIMILTRPSGAGTLWPLVTIATKSETYDIFSESYPSTKVGELTITVRKYTNQVIEGVSGLTYYELDDDISFEITNSTYKSRPTPPGSESIPLHASSDMIFTGGEDFNTGLIGGSIMTSTGVPLGKWFNAGAGVDSDQSWDLDDWWANPSSTAVWGWKLNYFSDNMNCETSPGEYADVVIGHS